jgi:hypothetical protein
MTSFKFFRFFTSNSKKYQICIQTVNVKFKWINQRRHLTTVYQP